MAGFHTAVRQDEAACSSTETGKPHTYSFIHLEVVQRLTTIILGLGGQGRGARRRCGPVVQSVFGDVLHAVGQIDHAVQSLGGQDLQQVNEHSVRLCDGAVLSKP